ncbi:MAG: YbaK/EbsC family protein [Caldilineaceae bacterium]|nr:YbaK/EbsC family protein [Caldilineaceae bacterium]
MNELPPVAIALAASHIPYRLFRHTGPVHSLAEAAQARGQHPSQVVRTILFRLRSADYFLVLMAGPGQIDWRALRRFVGQSRLTLATEAEVLQITGYVIGAVAPFGLPQPLRVLVDESVLAQAEVSIGSGQRGVAVILTVPDLMAALGSAEVGHFGVVAPTDER